MPRRCSGQAASRFGPGPGGVCSGPVLRVGDRALCGNTRPVGPARLWRRSRHNARWRHRSSGDSAGPARAISELEGFVDREQGLECGLGVGCGEQVVDGLPGSGEGQQGVIARFLGVHSSNAPQPVHNGHRAPVRQARFSAPPDSGSPLFRTPCRAARRAGRNPASCRSRPAPRSRRCGPPRCRSRGGQRPSPPRPRYGVRRSVSVRGPESRGVRSRAAMSPSFTDPLNAARAPRLRRHGGHPARRSGLRGPVGRRSALRRGWQPQRVGRPRIRSAA